MRIEVKGVESLKSKLAELGAEMPEAVRMAVQWSGKEVQGAAKYLCPTSEGGGTLKNSITERTEIDGDSATSTTGTSLYYGPYAEFGTGQRGYESGGDKAPGITGYRADWAGMPAQPFLYPAIKSRRKAILAKFTERVLRAIKKISGGAT